MYIAPQGIINLYKAVPVDLNFDHTLFFANRTAQNNFFLTKRFSSYSAQMYQRVSKGKLRIKATADDIYDCNYLSFKNVNTVTGSMANTRTFYCFITNVEYINNLTSEITYKVDPLQTWLPNIDYDLLACFIERQHTLTDNIGENLVPENLETGEYIHGAPEIAIGTANDPIGGGPAPMKIVVAATFDTNYDDYAGSWISGLFSGLRYNMFDNTVAGATQAANFIDGATRRGKANGIVSVFYAPAPFVHEGGAAKRFTIQPGGVMSEGQLIEGYRPRNNKLYTYPYRFLYVTNYQGKTKVYPYEYFSNPNIVQFTLAGDFTSNPTVIMAPINFLGETGTNYDQMITISGWPQCAYNTDTFKAWLAQTAASLPFSIMQMGWNAEGMNIRANTALEASRLAGNGAFNAAIIGTSAMPELAVLSAASSIANILSEGAQAAIKANQPHGAQAGTTLAACGLLDFGIYHFSIRREFAEIIDNYFDMYGYAIHRVEQPMVYARKRYTYVKTQGCKINGNIPSDAEKLICDIFDRGVTFWADTSHVGIYSGNPLLTDPE